jgi:UDP-glucose 4-epimerase
MNKGKTVLITGVAGFLGRHVARHYHQKGFVVVGIDMAPPENAPVASLSKYVRVTMPNSSMHEIIRNTHPDECIHCAGRASVGVSIADPHDDFYSSPVVTFELLDALRLNAPQCRHVFISSAAVYGNPKKLPVDETCPVLPISPYGFHKLQCEEICREFAKVYGMTISIARIFSAYGPGLRRQVVWDICHKVLTQKSILLQGTGGETRDFIHAIDIAAALQTIAKAASTEPYVCNIASGAAVTIHSLAAMIIETLGVSIRPEFDGIVPQGNPIHWQADISKLKSAGYSSQVPFESGVATSVKWCKAELTGI